EEHVFASARRRRLELDAQRRAFTRLEGERELLDEREIRDPEARPRRLERRRSRAAIPQGELCRAGSDREHGAGRELDAAMARIDDDLSIEEDDIDGLAACRAEPWDQAHLVSDH